MEKVEVPPSQIAAGSGKALLLWAARLLLSCVFLYAAVMKLRNQAAFHEDVLNFQWISDPVAAWTALILPVVELVCGVAVLFPAWSRAAGIILSVLLLGFIVALVRAWASGLDLHCGCFGPTASPVNYPWKLAQNAGLFFAAVSLVFARGGR